MVPSTGLEPVTYRLGGDRSILTELRGLEGEKQGALGISTERLVAEGDPGLASWEFNGSGLKPVMPDPTNHLAFLALAAFFSALPAAFFSAFSAFSAFLFAFCSSFEGSVTAAALTFFCLPGS